MNTQLKVRLRSDDMSNLASVTIKLGLCQKINQKVCCQCAMRVAKSMIENMASGQVCGGAYHQAG